MKSFLPAAVNRFRRASAIGALLGLALLLLFLFPIIAYAAAPTVTAASSGYYEEEAFTNALTGNVKGNFDIYTKITFSEDVAQTVSDLATARPQISYGIKIGSNTTTTQYHIIAASGTLGSGDCKSTHATQTREYVCKYTTSSTGSGLFDFRVGTGTTDKSDTPIAMASAYTHSTKLGIDSVAPNTYGYTFLGHNSGFWMESTPFQHFLHYHNSIFYSNDADGNIGISFGEAVYSDASRTAFTDTAAKGITTLKSGNSCTAVGNEVDYSASMASTGGNANKRITINPTDDLEQGTYCVSIGSAYYDSAGNVAAAASSHVFVIDYTPPKVRSAGFYTDKEATIPMAAILQGATFYMKVVFSENMYVKNGELSPEIRARYLNANGSWFLTSPYFRVYTSGTDPANNTCVTVGTGSRTILCRTTVPSNMPNDGKIQFAIDEAGGNHTQDLADNEVDGNSPVNSSYKYIDPVFVIVNPSVGQLVLTTTDLTINEAGENNSDSFNVALSSNPTDADGDVKVAIGIWPKTGTRIATVRGPNTLTFTPSNGTTAQTVTIDGVVDRDDSDGTATIRIFASQAKGPFASVQEDINLTVKDTVSRPAIQVSPDETIKIAEGGSGTFALSLAQKPTDDVTVWMERHPDVPLVPSPASLTFTESNYKTAQTVTLYAGDNTTGSATQLIQFAAAGSNGDYDDVTTRLMTVEITDATITNPLKFLVGGQEAYQVTVTGAGHVNGTVELPAAPSSNVTVSVAESPTGEFTNQFESNGLFTSSSYSKGLRFLTEEDADTDDERVLVTLSATGYANRYLELVKIDTNLKESEKPPTFSIGSLNNSNAFDVTFSKAVGTCSTKTQTSAAERVCSGTVTAFTDTNVDDLFEVVVDKADHEVTWAGDSVTFTATISGSIVTITPDVPAGALSLRLLIKDRYWSVNGGVLGARSLQTVKLKTNQATARLIHDSDGLIEVRIDSAKALGAAGNAWTLVPQKSGSLDTRSVTAHDGSKELRIRFGNSGSTRAQLVTAINEVSGFTVVASSGSASYTWGGSDSDSKFREDEFYGGFGTGRGGGNSPPPPQPTPEPPDPPVLPGLTLPGTPTPTPTPTPNLPNFDGKTFEVQHVTDDSTACLDVSGGIASDGQDVQTWDCNDTDAQKWTFEKRTAGDYKGSYRLVSNLGDDSYCLDNRGDFSTSDRMGIWQCVDDSHGAAANQSVTIAAEGDGYTITFTRNSDNKSVWLVTDRASGTAQGGANQTTVSGTAGASAIWQIEDDSDTTPVQQDSDFDGQTYEVQHVTDDSTACLDVSGGTASDGQDVQTWECNDTDAQKWTFEKRTAGDYKGSYRLVSNLGDDSYCLDNRGDFSTSDRMGIWECVDDTHGAAANQSVTIAAEGDGYTITFTRNSDNKSVWLVTDRASDSAQGGANQTTVSGTAGASAIWSIVSD